MLMFLWTPAQTVFYEGVAHFARGMLALLINIAYIRVDFGKMHEKQNRKFIIYLKIIQNQ